MGVQALNREMSQVMLLTIEVAMEFWLSLQWSPQVQWLRDADTPCSSLQQEVRGQGCLANQLLVGMCGSSTFDREVSFKECSLRPSHCLDSRVLALLASWSSDSLLKRWHSVGRFSGRAGGMLLPHTCCSTD